MKILTSGHINNNIEKNRKQSEERSCFKRLD